MWVRIQEVSFSPSSTDEVISHVRNTAVSRCAGEGYRGFRLLVDRPNGRALEVSYWDSEEAVQTSDEPSEGSSADLPGATVERTEWYELAIDAA
jgi:heme-degrading monooxygenase HmoA